SCSRSLNCRCAISPVTRLTTISRLSPRRSAGNWAMRSTGSSKSECEVREPSRVTGDKLMGALFLRSWSTMKAMQAGSQRWMFGVTLVVLIGCALGRGRAIVGADGEILESVARDQLAGPHDTLGVVASPLRMDSRPAGDNTDLKSTPDKPKRLEIGDSTDSVLPGVREVIVEQRKGILASLGITDGGPFDYPDCGGARIRRSRDTAIA